MGGARRSSAKTSLQAELDKHLSSWKSCGRSTTHTVSDLMRFQLHLSAIIVSSTLYWSACASEDDSKPSTTDTSNATDTSPNSQKASIAPWGFDLTGMDDTAKPGESFYAYANGH